MQHPFALASLLLSLVGCAVNPPAVERTKLETDPANVDGIYEFTTSVTARHASRSSSISRTHMVSGTFRLAAGRLAELINDHSSPCRAEDSGPVAPLRATDPGVTRVVCPDLTLTITRDPGEPLQSQHIAVRVRVMESVEGRGPCNGWSDDRRCISWEWVTNQVQSWRSARTVTVNPART